MTARTIVTTYDPPPIPVRDADWSAVDDDTYDGAPDSPTRGQIGHGATEAEAIADLLEQLDDADVCMCGDYRRQHDDRGCKICRWASPWTCDHFRPWRRSEETE